MQDFAEYCAEGQAPMRSRLRQGSLVPWAHGNTGVSTCNFVDTGMLSLLASPLGVHGDTADIILDLQRMALAEVYPLTSPLFHIRHIDHFILDG